MKFFAEYDFEIKQRKGRAKTVPDFLSRIEREEPNVKKLDKGDLVNLIWPLSNEYEERSIAHRLTSFCGPEE